MSAPRQVRQMPWLADALAQLSRMLLGGRMPHALSIEGPSGIGKRLLATHLQHWLLCARPATDGPCGDCAECELLRVGHHPDLILLEPDSKSGRQITVAAIRGLGERLALRPQRQGRQVALLQPAEAMNLSSANALLKTLEEPASDAHLLLVSHQPARLPITILSRCVRLSIAGPDDSGLRSWLAAQQIPVSPQLLQQCAGRPLQALEAHEQGLQAHWQAVQAEIDACLSGRATPQSAALRLHGQADATLDYLARLLEWRASRQLGPEASVGLTSLRWQSTLSEAWHACRRMSTELGSGLREDLGLAQVLRLSIQALREAPAPEA